MGDTSTLLGGSVSRVRPGRGSVVVEGSGHSWVSPHRLYVHPSMPSHCHRVHCCVSLVCPFTSLGFNSINPERKRFNRYFLRCL